VVDKLDFGGIGGGRELGVVTLEGAAIGCLLDLEEVELGEDVAGNGAKSGFKVSDLDFDSSHLGVVLEFKNGGRVRSRVGSGLDSALFGPVAVGTSVVTTGAFAGAGVGGAHTAVAASCVVVAVPVVTIRRGGCNYGLFLEGSGGLVAIVLVEGEATDGTVGGAGVPVGAVAVGTVAVTTAAAHVRHGYFFTKVHGALHVKVFLTEELLQEVHDLLVFIGLGRGGEKAESEGEHLHWRLYEELARK